MRVFETKRFKQQKYILQDENGPCALIALCNALILAGSEISAFVKARELLDSEELETQLLKLAELKQVSHKSVLNTKEIGDLKSIEKVIHKIHDGMDVDPRFNGDFANSAETDLFRLFEVPILHGWVLGSTEMADLGIKTDFSTKSYEECCEMQFDRPSTEFNAFIAFYSSQITPSGLELIKERVNEGQYAVLFWNNHFSTITHRNNNILLLATDLGYKDSTVCWETLDLSGAGVLVHEPEALAPNSSSIEQAVIPSPKSEIPHQNKESKNLKLANQSSKRGSKPHKPHKPAKQAKSRKICAIM